VMYSAVCISINHSYGDGNMLVNFFQCLSDADLDSVPAELLTIMTTSSPLPVLQRAAYVLQTLFYTPLALIQLYLRNKKSIFNSKSVDISSEKLRGLALSAISIGTMSKIRAAFNCQTRSVIAHAFLQSLKCVAERKGFEPPNEINLQFTHAVLPYSKVKLENRTAMHGKRLPMSGSQTKNLARIDELLQLNEDAQQQLSFCFWGIHLLGCLPIKIWSAVYPYFVLGPCTISLVPFPLRQLTLQSDVVEYIAPIPPLFVGAGEL